MVSNLGDEPLPDVKLELADGPLCGTPDATVAFSTAGAPAPTIGAPVITPTGGLADWPLGPMAPHQDLVITLTP